MQVASPIHQKPLHFGGRPFVHLVGASQDLASIPRFERFSLRSERAIARWQVEYGTISPTAGTPGRTRNELCDSINRPTPWAVLGWTCHGRRLALLAHAVKILRFFSGDRYTAVGRSTPEQSR